MSSEFGYDQDPLRLSIISFITFNPNSTLEDIFRRIPASHTKVRHWLQELLRSNTITASATLCSIPLQQITWSLVAGGTGDPWIQQNNDHWIQQNGDDWIQQTGAGSSPVLLLELGDKRCGICEIFVQWDGKNGLCCGYMLRTKPKEGKSRQRMLIKHVKRI